MSTSSAKAPLLELRGLSCERDQRCLFADLSLSASAGNIVQIVGPNGSGKTSLIRLLTTLSGEYEGDILWQGESLARSRLDYLNHWLYLGHSPAVKKALSPRENLAWFSGMSAGHPQIPLSEALEHVGLAGFEDVPCYSLSAGQLRRVALARLYLTPARVWVLDEPFTAIDVQGVAKLETLIAEHAAGGGLVFLSTHQALQIDGVIPLNLMDFQAGEDYYARAEGWGS